MRAGGHREWSTGCGRKLGVPDGRIAQQTVHGKLLEGGEAILAELVNDQDGGPIDVNEHFCQTHLFAAHMYHCLMLETHLTHLIYGPPSL